MTQSDKGLADEIERRRHPEKEYAQLALSYSQWQQIIAALRQSSDAMLWKSIGYAITLLEVEHDWEQCLQYLIAVRDKLAAAEAK